MGTDDIVTIVRKYQSRTFGFASRNFYVCFLAALEVDRNPQTYFGGIVRKPTIRSHTVRARPLHARRCDRNRVRRRSRHAAHAQPVAPGSVWNGSRFVPRGSSCACRTAAAFSTLGRLARVPGTSAMACSAHPRIGGAQGRTLATIARARGTSPDPCEPQSPPAESS